MKHLDLKLIILFVFGIFITSCSDDNGNDQLEAIIDDPVDNFTGNPFVTTWETTSDNEIIYPFYLSGGGFNISVDWGDGNTTINEESSLSHTYATANIYTIKLYGVYPRLRVAVNKNKIMSVEGWGDQEWDNMDSFFSRCENLIVNATDAPNLSNVTSMSDMFAYATSFNQDISTWNVSNITNMSSMFLDATSFNQNLSSWNVSNVTNMKGLFAGAISFNQNLNSWDVSNVLDMTGVFFRANFNRDISGWDVSSVIDMGSMFAKNPYFNQNISDWNVGNVLEMDSMFFEATNFNQDLSDWDTSNVNRCTNFSVDSALTTSNLPTSGSCF